MEIGCACVTLARELVQIKDGWSKVYESYFNIKTDQFDSAYNEIKWYLHSTLFSNSTLTIFSFYYEAKNMEIETENKSQTTKVLPTINGIDIEPNSNKELNNKNCTANKKNVNEFVNNDVNKNNDNNNCKYSKDCKESKDKIQKETAEQQSSEKKEKNREKGNVKSESSTPIINNKTKTVKVEINLESSANNINAKSKPTSSIIKRQKNNTISNSSVVNHLKSSVVLPICKNVYITASTNQTTNNQNTCCTTEFNTKEKTISTSKQKNSIKSYNHPLIISLGNKNINENYCKNTKQSIKQNKRRISLSTLDVDKLNIPLIDITCNDNEQRNKSARKEEYYKRSLNESSTKIVQVNNETKVNKNSDGHFPHNKFVRKRVININNLNNKELGPNYINDFKNFGLSNNNNNNISLNQSTATFKEVRRSSVCLEKPKNLEKSLLKDINRKELKDEIRDISGSISAIRNNNFKKTKNTVEKKLPNIDTNRDINTNNNKYLHAQANKILNGKIFTSSKETQNLKSLVGKNKSVVTSVVINNNYKQKPVLKTLVKRN